MKSSIFVTIDASISEYTLEGLRDRIRQLPGIERVVALPDKGPNHLHMAVCQGGADVDLIIQRVRQLPHIASTERGRL